MKSAKPAIAPPVKRGFRRFALAVLIVSLGGRLALAGPVSVLLSAFDANESEFASRNQVQLELGVLRIQSSRGVKTNQLSQDLAEAKTFLVLARSLNKLGKVNILYDSTRDFSARPGDTLEFSAFETRPSFGSLSTNSPPPPRLGLTLRFKTLAFRADAVALSWAGEISWSKSLLEDPKWVERGLMLGFNFAQRMGMGFPDEVRKKGIRAPTEGINGMDLVGGFFKKAKAKEAPKSEVKIDQDDVLSYLESKPWNLSLAGQAMLSNHQAFSSAFETVNSTPERPEWICIYVQQSSSD